MILYSEIFDQYTLAKMRQHDPVVVFYRTFFNLIDWNPASLAHQSFPNSSTGPS